MPTKTPPNTKKRIEILDGIRCILSICITIVHTNFFTGGVTFKSNSLIVTELKSIPLFGFICNVPFPVDLFWIISGFLCQLKLTSIYDDRGGDEKDGDGSSSSNAVIKKNKIRILVVDYSLFFLNRILRLYPLYFLQVLLNYYTNDACTSEGVTEALTFFSFSYSKESSFSSPCVSIGWTSAVDVHGYFILILLSFVFLREKKKRRCSSVQMHEWACFTLYAYSVCTVIYNTIQLQQDELYKENPIVKELLGGTRAWTGVDLISAKVARYYTGRTPGIPLQEEEEGDLETARMFLKGFKRSVYYTGVFGHGGVMFLGALLALNWNAYHNYSNHSRMPHTASSSKWIYIRALCGIFVLYLTGGFLHFAGMPFYWLLRAFLHLETQISSSSPSGTNTTIHSLSKALYHFLTLPIWKYISKYTYGIYLTHLHIVRYLNRNYFARVDKGDIVDDLEEHYISFFIGRAVQAWSISLIVSILLYFCMELPFIAFRRRYLNLGYSSSSGNRKGEESYSGRKNK